MRAEAALAMLLEEAAKLARASRIDEVTVVNHHAAEEIEMTVSRTRSDGRRRSAKVSVCWFALPEEEAGVRVAILATLDADLRRQGVA